MGDPTHPAPAAGTPIAFAQACCFFAVIASQIDAASPMTAALEMRWVWWV